MDDLDDYNEDLFGPSADDLAAIGTLLNNPRLAHIFHTLYVEGNVEVETNDYNPHLWGGLTVSELQEYVDIPQSTLYNDLTELVEIGAIYVASESQPKGYSARFLEAEGKQLNEFDEDKAIASTRYIGLVGQAYRDEVVADFLDEYGHDNLWKAHLMYRESVMNRLDYDYTELMLEVPDDRAESIIPALQYILQQMSRDPLWHEDYSEALEGD